jgi:hypothetical protein
MRTRAGVMADMKTILGRKMRLIMPLYRAIFLSAMSLLPGCLGFGSTSPAQAQDTYHDEIGWWSITHRRVANLSGCDAVARFSDQTMMAMALIQVDSAKKEWVLLISNPRWDSWLRKKTRHEFRLVATKRWQATFFVTSDEKSLFFSNAPIDLVNSIGDARSLTIMTGNNRLLTRSLDMKNSGAAIKAVVTCVRERTPASLSTPKSEEPLF